MVRFRPFGEAAIEIGAETVVIRSRAEALLLAVLCYDPRNFDRASLASLMWPDSAPDAARASLRVALSGLRKKLPENAILDRGGALALNRTIVEGESIERRDSISETAFLLGVGGPWVEQFRSKLSPAGSSPVQVRTHQTSERGPQDGEDHVLFQTAEWLLERSARDAAEFVISVEDQWETLDVGRAHRLHASLLKRLPVGAASRRRVYARAAMLLWQLRGLPSELEALDAAFEGAVNSGESLVAANLALSIAYGHLSRGAFANSEKLARRAKDLAESSLSDSLGRERISIGYNVIALHTRLRPYDPAVQMRLADQLERRGDPRDLAEATQVIAEADLAAGRHTDCERRLDFARIYYESAGMKRALAWNSIDRALLHQMRGEFDVSVEHAKSVVEQSPAAVGHSAHCMALDLAAASEHRLGRLESSLAFLAQGAATRRALGTKRSEFERRAAAASIAETSRSLSFESRQAAIFRGRRQSRVTGFDA